MRNIDEEKLLEEYAPKKKTGLDEAKKLDRKAKLPALILAYTFGIIGTLVLGVGMCIAMKVIGDGSAGIIALGIIIGIAGIAMVSANYPIYKVIERNRKEKYASAIILALNKDKQQ